MVFLIYLGIAVFVWARAVCGTRIDCCAAVDCSGTAQKIYLRKIRQVQGDEHTWKCDGIHDLGTFDEAPRTLQSSWVRADAQC